MESMLDPRATEVLDFWFGAPDQPFHLQTRPEWFRKDPAFDAQIRTRFGTLIEAALRGELQGWAALPRSALARIVVLDQFPRNVFRGSARMFDGDVLALAAAREMLASGTDRSLAGVQRQFVYLPFEHSEVLANQQQALHLFGQLEAEQPALQGLTEWARKHHDIVARFGRFPHRNATLGRPSTPEELEFLKQPGSGF
jgi:uncharacterized protein (DUF924 family)